MVNTTTKYNTDHIFIMKKKGFSEKNDMLGQNYAIVPNSVILHWIFKKKFSTKSL